MYGPSRLQAWPRHCGWVVVKGHTLFSGTLRSAAARSPHVRSPASSSVFLGASQAEAPTGSLLAGWAGGGGESRRLATRHLRPLAVWMVAPVAMPTPSGLPSKLNVNLLRTREATAPQQSLRQRRPPRDNGQKSRLHPREPQDVRFAASRPRGCNAIPRTCHPKNDQCSLGCMQVASPRHLQLSSALHAPPLLHHAA